MKRPITVISFTNLTLYSGYETKFTKEMSLITKLGYGQLESHFEVSGPINKSQSKIVNFIATGIVLNYKLTLRTLHQLKFLKSDLIGTN
jgi:hypothetical protein